MIPDVKWLFSSAFHKTEIASRSTQARIPLLIGSNEKILDALGIDKTILNGFTNENPISIVLEGPVVIMSGISGVFSILFGSGFEFDDGQESNFSFLNLFLL